MLEAINTMLQGGSVLRKAEQATSADSLAANPKQVQRVAQAPFISPYTTVAAGDMVVQYRDSTTGKVLQQIPSQTNLEAQQQHDIVQEAAQTVPKTSVNAAPAPAATTAGNTDGKSDMTADNMSTGGVPVTNQQQTAFVNASRAGNINAGNITLLA